MFTDLVGYSALSQKNEALALELLEEHRQLLRPLFAQHNGQEIKTIGDAFLVEFTSAVEAARCAIDIQKALTAHTSVVAPERRIQVRIGLHVGDVVIEEGDVLGDGVNIASRIEPLAAPGGICVSGTVADQVKNKIALPLESLGEQRLKNIEEPVTVYRIVLPWYEGTVPSKRARPALQRPGIIRWIGAGAAILLLVAVVWWLASRVAPVVKPGEITSIAVLPLDNLMGEPDQDYFVDGMHEAIISNLSRLSALKVISRTSAMRYKDTDKLMPEIARELGVDALVEGSVLKAGNRVRITAQLIHGASDEHLWANDYEGDLTDILSLQKTVAGAIAREIGLALKPEEEARLASAQPVDPEAYKAYLKGSYFLQRFTKEDLDLALDHFNQALNIAPDFALAHAGVAATYIALVDAYLPPSEAYPKARDAAEKAIQLDEQLAEAHVSLASVRAWWEWNWNESRRELDRALELNPNSAEAYWQWIFYWLAMNDPAEAVRSARRACELDPLSAIFSLFLEWSYFFNNQYDEAIAQHDITQELSPGLVYSESTLGLSLSEKGLYDEAIRAFEEAERTIGHVSLGKGVTLANMGRKEEALEIARELEAIFDETYIIPEWIASIYAAAGDKERAYTWLERGLEERSSGVIILQVLPGLRTLHGEQRFNEILERVGLK